MKRTHVITAALVALLMAAPIAEAQTGDSIISGRWQLTYVADYDGEWYGRGSIVLEFKVENGKLMGKVLKPAFDMAEMLSLFEIRGADKQPEEKHDSKPEWRLIKPQFDGTRLRFKIDNGEGVLAVEMKCDDAAFEGRWQIEGSVIKGTIKMTREDSANK